MKLKIMMAIVAITLSVNAMAGLMIEPYVGTGNGSVAFDASALEDSDSDGGLTTMGARLGYSMLLFSAGVDYQMDTLEDGNKTDLAAFVGVDLPILLRFYGKYYLSSNLDIDDVDFDIAHKGGYAVGVGFTGLPFVVLNLEVEAQNYVLEDVTTLGDVDLAYAATKFTISLPLP